jgi:prolyl-tRNA editing enzyme YbaK/EbsC (Cys-tRNA(Pro) deacylase)
LATDEHSDASLRSLPEPVRRVARYLGDARAEARLQEFKQGTPTAAQAAEAAGCELDQIVKSLLFVCDDKPVLVLVPGSYRADAGKVAAAVESSSARIATPAQVKSITGFEVGGVAPFPAPGGEVLIERSLLSWTLVWVGAGSDRHMAALAPTELLRLTKARAVDVCADP